MKKTDFILVLIGPTGSGKSTVAEKLARKFDQCVEAVVDILKLVQSQEKIMIVNSDKIYE